MRSKDFVSLARKLLPQFPSMNVHGTMLVVTPIRPVLRGLYFEGSSFDAKSFYVWAFWMPLYVPAETVSFNLGKRIRDESGGDRWSAADARVIEKLSSAIHSDALPYLRELKTAQDVVEAAKRAAGGSKDPYVHQALAYSLAKAGDTTAAVDSIDVLLGLLNPVIPWQAELRTRAQLLKETIIAKKKMQRRCSTVGWPRAFGNLVLRNSHKMPRSWLPGTERAGPRSRDAAQVQNVGGGQIRHQTITRGVGPSTLRNTIANPTSVISQAGGTLKYVGEQAVIVLNKSGKVVTAWLR